MLDKKFINKMQNKLEQERKRLERDLASFANKNIHNLDDYETRFPDFGEGSDENAREVAAFEDNLNLERTLEKELRDVVGALKRIADGTYGKCYNCQIEIPQERLEARPTASTCIKCKTEFKSRS